MRLWNVENPDARRLLGDPAERTFYAWKGGKMAKLPADTIRRIGYVAGIYKALQILYPDSRQADDWIRRPNRHFGGQTPLERMTAGDVTDPRSRQGLSRCRPCPLVLIPPPSQG